MHELSITQSVVAIVQEKAQGRTVREVTLQIGQLSGIEIQAVRFCWDLCIRNTALDRAALVIDEVQGRGTCLECGEQVVLDQPIGICPCERRGFVRIDQGEELLVKTMEVEDHV